MILRAQRREIHEPVLKLVRELGTKSGGRRIAVLIPEVVWQRWYQHLLHTSRTRQLHSRLLDCGESRLIVVDVPWHLDDEVGQ